MALKEHLAWWGLKRFTSDSDYFDWQRQQLPPGDLNKLHEMVRQKRRGNRRDEVAFYNFTTQPKILPVLYSQRYQYYEEIGSRVASHLDGAKRILDFGCGIGILTTLYARRFPEMAFIGVDRSPGSIAVARQKARELGLSNVRFDCVDVDTEPLAGLYDVAIATHALMQVEQDSGIPSKNWQTFDRAQDVCQQAAYEQRTGVGVRLDRLATILDRNGRMIVFEKTRSLARRVPFQRALAARGLKLLEQPELVRYPLVQEVVDDGPYYLLRKGSEGSQSWNEAPEPDEGTLFDPKIIPTQPYESDRPLYENHWPSAQMVREKLKDRRVMEQTTRQESDGRQLHVELGTAEGLSYLYVANTFDQRQLVIVETTRATMLNAYFLEIMSGIS